MKYKPTVNSYYDTTLQNFWNPIVVALYTCHCEYICEHILQEYNSGTVKSTEWINFVKKRLNIVLWEFLYKSYSDNAHSKSS